MFLFVSHTCFKRSGFAQVGCGLADFKKAGLSVALLMASLMAHAGSPEMAEKVADNAQPVLQSQQNKKRDESVQRFNFPHWPQHRQRNKEIIPPPPPGPYMSSALSDYVVRAPVPRHHVAKHVPYSPPVRHNVSPPMGIYSPDIPWPKHLRPQPQQPDHQATRKAPHYVKPMASRKSVQGAASSKNHSYYYRNGPLPHRNSINMNNSRGMPSMGMPPAGPYDNRLNYVPDYRSNHGSRYNRPMTSNDGKASASHANR